MRNRITKNRILRFSSNLRVEMLLLALICVFSILSPDFFSWLNFRNLLLQNTHMFIVVAGLAFIMIGGGVDLSIGYQISLVTVVIGLLTNHGISPILACLAGVMTGFLCGLINGWMVAKLKIVPYAATMVSMLLFRGLSYSISDGRSFGNISQWFRTLTREVFCGIHVDLWIALLCMLFAHVVFKYTFWGKQIRAIGENKQATQRSGVDITKVTVWCYVTASSLYAVAAIILISVQGVASPASGVGMEVTAIAAMFIAGVTCSTEKGITGNVDVEKLVGAVLICGIIENGVQMLGGSQFIKHLLVFAIVLLNMTEYRYRQRSKG